MRDTISKEKVERIVKARESGVPYASLAERFGVTTKAIKSALERYRKALREREAANA